MLPGVPAEGLAHGRAANPPYGRRKLFSNLYPSMREFQGSHTEGLI